MMTPVEQLRQALSGYEAERSERLLYRMRGQDPGPPSGEQRRRATWLLGDGAEEALELAVSRGELPPDGELLVRTHIARLAARGVVVEAQAALRARLAAPLSEQDGEAPAGLLLRVALLDSGKGRAELGRKALTPLRGELWRLLGAYEEARERFPLAFPSVDEPERAAARLLLERTDAALAEQVREWVRPHQREARDGGVAWHTLMRSVRGESFDGIARASNRFRRLAQPLAALGFEQHLSKRVRVEGLPRAALRSQCLIRDMPGDIRLVHPGRDGLVEDTAGARVLGRALAWSLGSAALPWERAYPAHGGPAPALAGLLAGWLADQGYLRAFWSAKGADGEQLAHHLARLLLLRVRLSASFIAEPEAGRDLDERVEWRMAQLQRALGCEVPPELAAMLWTGHARQRDAGIGDLQGLALHVALREAFDEDCYRNPRTAEALRALCEPGAAADARGFLEASSVGPEAVAGRLLELLP